MSVSWKLLIIATAYISTTACLVAIAEGGDKGEPQSAAVANSGGPDITELEQVKRYMQMDRSRRYKSMIHVDLSNTRATDAALKHLSGLTNIGYLAVNNTRITDAGLVHLKELNSLEVLFLAGNQISDAGLVSLRGLTNLRTLDLADTPLTDAGLDHLKGLSSLHYLGIARTKVTELGVSKLKQSLPKVFVFALGLPDTAHVPWLMTKQTCRNNLKRIMLAALVYADGHDGKFPSDLSSMTEELGNPGILFCGEDKKHSQAVEWGKFSGANVTYEFVAPGLDRNKAPSDTIVFRCPIHDMMAYTDGRVEDKEVRPSRLEGPGIRSLPATK